MKKIQNIFPVKAIIFDDNFQSPLVGQAGDPEQRAYSVCMSRRNFMKFSATAFGAGVIYPLLPSEKAEAWVQISVLGVAVATLIWAVFIEMTKDKGSSVTVSIESVTITVYIDASECVDCGVCESRVGSPDDDRGGLEALASCPTDAIRH